MKNSFTLLSSNLAAEFDSWESHPELSKLHKKLKITTRSQWYDHYTEAMVARYLLQQGCEIAVEVPTANGKCADFKVAKSGEAFFAHVKRLTVDQETRSHHNWCYQQFLRLRKLEEIQRPLLVEVNLRHALTKREAVTFVRIAKPFIEQARTRGERFTVVGTNGKDLGHCEILHCSLPDGRVILYPDSDYPRPRDSARFLDKLGKAYKQFMPGATNVILAAGECISRSEFENALRGEHRWLRDRKSKEIVKSTNPLDGYWSGTQSSNSQIAVWLEIQDEAINFELFFREKRNPTVPRLVTSLFGPSSSGELSHQTARTRPSE